MREAPVVVGADTVKVPLIVWVFVKDKDPIPTAARPVILKLLKVFAPDIEAVDSVVLVKLTSLNVTPVVARLPKDEDRLTVEVPALKVKAVPVKEREPVIVTTDEFSVMVRAMLPLELNDPTVKDCATVGSAVFNSPRVIVSVPVVARGPYK